MLGIRLSEDIETRLANLAEQTGRTKSYYAREAIISYLEKMEDYLLAAKEYEDFIKSGQEDLSAEDVRRRLGLDD